MYTAPGFLCRAAGKAGVSEYAVLPLKGSHDCSAACIKRHRARSNGGPDSFTLKQTTPLLSRHISAAAAVAAVRGQSRNSAQRRLIESHQNNAFARPLLISIPSLSLPGLTDLGLDTARGTTTQLEASRIPHRASASVAAVLSLSCCCCCCRQASSHRLPTPPPPTTTLEITVRLFNRHSEVTRAPDSANPAIAFPRWCSSTPAPSETYSSPKGQRTTP